MDEGRIKEVRNIDKNTKILLIFLAVAVTLVLGSHYLVDYYHNEKYEYTIKQGDNEYYRGMIL